MIGAGIAEKTGLMEVLMKQSINKVPKKLVTGTIIFVGIVANAAADAGFIVLPPLAALVFCQPPQVSLSVINGIVRVQDGVLLGIELPNLIEQHNRIALALANT